ncbi:hypothetical protein TIFTF001_023292 [Ficus carica]|uniref:Retrotransposon gag domain-containing protein n=1 Tax=Ficus carica TaxID=3494 RepID=A0AA88DF79_FICCA|nr:hypothetical protein TIFTF001_023292 [Ficus carica]
MSFPDKFQPVQVWSRLAVIQLRGAVRRWWESIGQDLNLIHWRDFRRSITEHFVVPFIYREKMVDSMYAQGCLFFTRAGVLHEIRALVYFPQPYLDYDHLCSEVIYAEMHLRVEMVDTLPTRGLENAEDASSHVEAPVPAPHQSEAVGDEDTRIDPEEED